MSKKVIPKNAKVRSRKTKSQTCRATNFWVVLHIDIDSDVHLTMVVAAGEGGGDASLLVQNSGGCPPEVAIFKGEFLRTCHF